LPSGLVAKSSRICSMKNLLRPYGLVIPTPTVDDSLIGDTALPYTVADDEKIKLRHPCVSRACDFQNNSSSKGRGSTSPPKPKKVYTRERK